MDGTPRSGRNSITRRRLLVAGAAGGVLAVGAGRLPGLDAPSGRAQDRVGLPFWTPGGSPVYCDAHAAIAEDFAAVNASAAVEFQCGTGEGFLERLLGSVAAGNPPEGTVLWDTPVSLGIQGVLRPLDDLMPTGQYTAAENWPAAVLASTQFGGQTWGLPVASPTYGIWYNQEAFEAKGVPSDRASFPKTWDELRRLSKEFTTWDGDRLTTAGFFFFNIDPLTLGGTLPIWSAANGGQIFDAANQRYTIDSEPNIAMFDYFVSWLDEEYKGDYAAVLRSGAWSMYPSNEGQPPQFQAGNLVMTEQASFGMGDFYAYGDPAFTRWEVAPYPVGPGGSQPVSGYWPTWLAIPAETEHPAEMFAYFDYLSGVGIEKWFAAVPDLPTNTKVGDLPAPAIVVEKRGEAFAEDVVQFFRDQFATATPMWDSPVQSFAIDQLVAAMEKIAAKERTPREALAEAQTACQAELEKVLGSQS